MAQDAAAAPSGGPTTSALLARAQQVADQLVSEARQEADALTAEVGALREELRALKAEAEADRAEAGRARRQAEEVLAGASEEAATIVVDANEQAALLIHSSNLYYHEFQGSLAKRLAGVSGLQRSFFANTGTEAMEGALKLIRAHGNAISQKKNEIIALENSFHGFYPSDLRSAQIGTSVGLSLVVDAAGSVIDQDIVDPSCFDTANQAASDLTRSIPFEPDSATSGR